MTDNYIYIHSYLNANVEDAAALEGGPLTEEQKVKQFELEAKALQFELGECYMIACYCLDIVYADVGLFISLPRSAGPSPSLLLIIVF